MGKDDLKIAAAVRDGKVQMHWKDEAKSTAEAIRRIPADKINFKPHEKSMSAIDLAQHIYRSEAMFVDGIVDSRFDYEGSGKKLGELPKDPQKLADQYLRFYAAAAPKLMAVTPGNLVKPLEFMPGMPPVPAYVYLSWLTSHSIHHRGQLTVYLRLMGAKVPAIYGPSADDNPFA